MAKYTYDDFVRDAESSGLYDKFSQADLELAETNPDAGMTILQAKKDYASATTDEQRKAANQAAEKARSTYGGYTGGADGMGKIPVAAQPMNWNQQLQETINKILNREEFSYDLNGDALYRQYKDQYTRQGKLAMEDTMGKAATLTGGYGNSYAQVAGQQAYQGYMDQLNDRIPELYQLALDKYDRETAALYDQYGLFAGERDQEVEMAQIAAQYGDYSYLKELGIDTSAMTSGDGYGGIGTTGGSSPENDDKTPLSYSGTIFSDIPDDSGLVAQAQAMLGVRSDGEWGVEAQMAAEAAGYRSFADVLAAMQANGYGNSSRSSGLRADREKEIEKWVESLFDKGISWEDLNELIDNTAGYTSEERSYAREVANFLRN